MTIPFGRRTFLGGAAAAGALLGRGGVAAGGPAPPVSPVPPGSSTMPAITPRAEWGGDLAPTGPLLPEEDVRFLLVHHTVDANTYAQGDVPGLLRAIYGFHTGDKGWSDVAYNFFIDRYGGIWEGRTGSLDGPVQVDATGGSQGFAQLCCLIGDHQVEAPTPEAVASLVEMLAWLGERHQIDTSVGAMTQFVSRGSNRWPAGTTVDARTISGHRDMSQTACPGDAAYALVAEELPSRATALRLEQAAAAAPSTTTSSSVPASTSTTVGSEAAAPTPPGSNTSTSSSDGDGGTDLVMLGAGTALVAGGLAALAALLRRRQQPPEAG